MIKGKSDEKPQGFVIVVDDCQANNWARMYVSKFGGEKKVKACGPHKLEIFRAVQECLLGCRRVVLLTRPYTIGSDRDELIQSIKQGYYPEIEVVRMLPL
jgi:hypothetical protein